MSHSTGSARAEAVGARLSEAFGSVPRPSVFVRESCWCCECQEHNETLAGHTPGTISLEQLGNAGWDPICFASDDAFLYYLPAMARLALESGCYWEHLLFHLSQPDRVAALNQAQAEAVLEALWLLVETRGEELSQAYPGCSAEDVMARLDSVREAAGQGPGQKPSGY
ncbi:MAG TPA: hypothetical protein VGN26_10585 [Armatimonadota bacterium]